MSGGTVSPSQMCGGKGKDPHTCAPPPSLSRVAPKAARSRIGGVKKEKNMSPLKVIRRYCVECLGGNSREVVACTTHKCLLFPLRFGKNPYRRPRVMSEIQRKAASERLKRARQGVSTSPVEVVQP
jgi:hypothetical protein